MTHPPHLPTPRDIRTAYRHLFQLGLRAVHYAKPARYTIATRLRVAFRLSPAKDWDPKRIHNTCQFLYNARDNETLEHRVLRCLLYTWYHDLGHGSLIGGTTGKDVRLLAGLERRRRLTKRRWDTARVSRMKDDERRIWDGRMDHFRFLVRMLNESMGLCLR